MAPLYGADRLLLVTGAHVDGCIYHGPAGLDFAERLAESGDQVAVPTSLNVVSLDRQRWRRLGIPPSFAEPSNRLAAAYLRMGASPTFTCTPYQTGIRPGLGEQVAWAESNAVAFANSVLGARTNRYGDFLDICCALTGRAPAAGLHLDEGRFGRLVLQLGHLPPALVERDDFYPVLGYLTGTLAGDQPVIIDGLQARPTEDQLKALVAAAASSGAVALCHIVGITPEAATLHDALGGRPAGHTRRISIEDLRATRSRLSTTQTGAVDLVAFGSPHCSLEECRHLANLMQSKRASPGVDVFITTSRAVYQILERSALLTTLTDFGAKVTADTCIVVAPLVKPGTKLLMTNSAKYAHYGPGLLGLETVFSSTEACVASAMSGTIVREDGPWLPA